MHAFDGDLLIGGMSLRNIHGELEQEEQAADSRHWFLSGQVRVPSERAESLELQRGYLLKLSDGREGIVELTRLSPDNGDLLAEFRPKTVKPR